MRSTIFIILMIFSVTSFAYELNGQASYLGNGRYSVVLHDDSGMEFVGQAVDQQDGEWRVTVHNKEGVTFTGIAMDNESDTYDLKLKDVATGNPANGILEVNFH